MGAHIEPLINELRTILRNPPPHLQALRSAATKAQWALRQSVGVPPAHRTFRGGLSKIGIVGP